MRRAASRLLALPCLLASVACSHVVTIDSDPPGAEIKVNSERLGTAPVNYTETTGWDKVYDIEAEKPGYKKTRRPVRQSEWNTSVVIGSIGSGVLLCPAGFGGLLFAKQLPDRVTVPLEADTSAAPQSDTRRDAPPAAVEDYGY